MPLTDRPDTLCGQPAQHIEGGRKAPSSFMEAGR